MRRDAPPIFPMTTLLPLLAALLSPAQPVTPRPSEVAPVAAPIPERAFGVVAFPVIAYAPETSGLLALVGVVFLPGKGPRPSSIRLTSGYTLNSQAALVLDPSVSLADGDWEIEGRVSLIDWRFPFQGFDGQSRRVWFGQPAFSSTFVFSRRLAPSVYVGVGGSYSLTDINPEEPLPPTLLGLDGGMMAGAIVETRYDSRDHPLTPRKGQRLLARFEARPDFMSDFAHNRVTAEARAFFGDGQHVFGVQAMWYGIYGDAPFFNLSTFGGQVEMRGVFRDRFRNHHSTFVQGEYRSPVLWWRMSFTGFAGAAATFGPLGPFTPTWSSGAGIRVLLSAQRRLNLRIDGAISRDELGAYLGLGEAF